MSMWVSNTATAVMMLPIALGVIELVRGDSGNDSEGSAFSTCLLLGIAYSASIGGVATIVGTPPNLFLASYAKSNLGVEISFARWMAVGVPLAGLFLPVTWLLLTRFLFPVAGERIEGGRHHIEELLRELGPVKRGEWITLAVFGVTAVTWISRPWLVELSFGGSRPLAGLTDPGVAIVAALALFVIPVDASRRIFTMDWETANGLPWGLLILFGGGLSLAAAIRANGLGEYIGHSMGFLGGIPMILVVAALVTLIIFLTELTSNTATTATFVPILAALAPVFDTQPLMLVVPAAVAASCAFMLPVATPPNAVVFGSGRIRLPEMCRAGIWLNGIGIVLITFLCYWFAMPLLGLSGGS
jgi:sodium-dependent dicarboxylate transporter 2/3/5